MGGKMKVVSVNSEELSGGIGRAQNAIDGNNKTIWQAEWYAPRQSIRTSSTSPWGGHMRSGRCAICPARMGG
jgi:hypothetical protein